MIKSPLLAFSSETLPQDVSCERDFSIWRSGSLIKPIHESCALKVY
jgi:hypothetical protein